MRVLVTGGAGFIGANLCRSLCEQDFAVRVIDDLSTGYASNLAGVDTDLRVASILDPAAIGAACDGVDAVVHLAARPSVPRSLVDPVASHRVNATGTLAVLEAARTAGVARVVLASSSSVYGANPVSPKHEGLPVNPLSPYAASKLAGEGYALAYQSSFGLPVLALRLFNVFGPLQSSGHAYAAVIPAFIAAALADEPVQLYGGGSQSRDFTYVESVCEVVSAALRDGVSNPGPVNLAFGTRTTLLELLAVISAELGRPVRQDTLPPRVGDIHDSRGDGTLLSKLFPTATPVPLAAGIARTVAWFRSTGESDRRPLQTSA